MILYQLTRPASYLAIKDHNKWIIDWLIPFIISSISTSIYFCLPVQKSLYGQDGAMNGFQDFLQMLPGFFLAALAAISTFNKPDLDVDLPSPTPDIHIKVNGHWLLIKLTRRRMLSYLFGYLTFLSLALYIVVACGSIISPSAYILAGEYKIVIKGIFLLFMNTFFWQMIIITVFGLYQLCDRIHQPDPPVRP